MLNVNDYLHARASAARVPLSGTFELSPVCNFACKMCYVRKTHEQIRGEGKRLRTWEEWLELGRQCRDAGMLYLLLTGGEPFLYPNFRELYTALHEMGIVLSINTNGTMIDEETVAWLKDHAPQKLNITLYGASRETYGRVCGNPEGYDRVTRAIALLQEAKIPLTLNVSMIPENADDLEKIMTFGKSRELNTRVATYMFPPVRREQESTDSRFDTETGAQMFMRKSRCLYSQERYVRFLRETLEKSAAPQPMEDDWGNNESEQMRCRAGRSSFWVTWDGDMTACGILRFPIVTRPFEKAFSQCWQELTDMVRSKTVLKGCAGCALREICKPCAAILAAETGDVNGKSEYLCRLSGRILELIREEAAKYEE